MGDRCTGHCCERFYLPYSPEELWANYRAWSTGTPDPGGRPTGQDIHLIAPMVRYLGWQPANGGERPDGGATHGHYYTCVHLDPVTKNCGIYEDRPAMCRDYPYGNPCSYQACTWDKARAGQHPDPRAAVFQEYGVKAPSCPSGLPKVATPAQGTPEELDAILGALAAE